MAQEMKQCVILATLLTTILLFMQLFPTVVCKPKLIPSDTSKLNTWLYRNMKEFKERKGKFNQINATLDKDLAKAEANVKVINVRKDGKGNFKTVTDAIKSIPMENANRVVVKISGGDYWEKITIDRSKKFITLYGDPNDMPKLVFDGTAATYGTLYSASVTVESDYFVAVNIVFMNSAPMPDGKREGAQAVAMRISGDKAAFHNCKFIGYQDTLCDDRGKHFFRDCYIQGTIDFIFGNGQSLYLNTTIKSVAKSLGVITAHARENVTEDSGFAFVHCSVIGTGDTYLGRAWKQRPRVIFAYTYMDTLINSRGWKDGMLENEHKPVYYGEYKCKGSGASSSGRAKFAKILSDAEIKPFLSMTYLNGNKWILPPPKV